MTKANSSASALKWWHAFVFIGVVALWAAVGYFASTRSQPGIFGDMFGAVNALFTGLAFAGVIITISKQSEELALQRKELQQTRAELVGQKDQLAAQNASLQRQNFENSFFQLLRLFRELARSRDGRGPLGLSVGEAFWPHLYDNLKVIAKGGDSARQDNTITDYGAYLDQVRQLLGPYFWTLQELLNLIESFSEAREPYRRVLRAQISDMEVKTIFYYGLLPGVSNTLKPLIERCGLLRQLPAFEQGEEPLSRLYRAGAFQEGGSAMYNQPVS